MRKFILNTEAARQIADDIEERFGTMPNYSYGTIIASINYEWLNSDNDESIGHVNHAGDPRWLISEELYYTIRATFITEITETLGVPWNIEKEVN